MLKARPIYPFIAILVFWALIVGGCVCLLSCGSTSLGANDIRRVKPTETSKPDTSNVSTSVDTAGGRVREVVRIVKVASGESAIQKVQIESLNKTIDDLNTMLIEQDDAIRAKFATLQRQVNELEATRLRLAKALIDADKAANEAKENLSLAKGHIIRLEGEIATAENEKKRLRAGWDAAIKTAENQERLKAKADKEAAKNLYWAKSWWKWCLWTAFGTFIFTCILFVVGWLYIKINPTAWAASAAGTLLNNRG